MKKKLVAAFALVFCCLCASLMSAMAAPETMSPYEIGVSGTYLDILNPETVVSTTTQSEYVLSGVSNPGVVVSVYYYDGASDLYRLMYVDGAAASQIIGSSGLFAQKIYLYEGSNYLLVRADSPAGGLPQISKLEIKLLVDSFWDSIKNAPMDIGQGMQAIFN